MTKIFRIRKIKILNSNHTSISKIRKAPEKSLSGNLQASTCIPSSGFSSASPSTWESMLITALPVSTISAGGGAGGSSLMAKSSLLTIFYSFLHTIPKMLSDQKKLLLPTTPNKNVCEGKISYSLFDFFVQLVLCPARRLFNLIESQKDEYIHKLIKFHNHELILRIMACFAACLTAFLIQFMLLQLSFQLYI